MLKLNLLGKWLWSLFLASLNPSFNIIGKIFFSSSCLFLSFKSSCIALLYWVMISFETSGSRTTRRTVEFGRTHVVKPKGKHQATIIWLHGLSDNGLRYFFRFHCSNPSWHCKWICCWNLCVCKRENCIQIRFTICEFLMAKSLMLSSS